jgi:hypothetical protein
MSVHHWYALKDTVTYGFEVLFVIFYALIVLRRFRFVCALFV